MNLVDILFIVDVTGSMGGFISTAQQKMQSVLKSLSTEFEMDLKVGLSLYRDHPPQDDSFVTVIFNLVSVAEIEKVLLGVSVDGGGDAPEAVIDGIVDGMNGIQWREGSRRIAFLIGDAPAHGMIDGEPCCQCGLTWGDAVVAAEKNRVSIYSIVLGGDIQAKENFRLISNFTGGFLIEGDDTMDLIVTTLKSEFDGMNLDSKVLEMLSSDKSEEEICQMLNIDREKLSQSTSRIVQHSL